MNAYEVQEAQQSQAELAALYGSDLA